MVNMVVLVHLVTENWRCREIPNKANMDRWLLAKEEKIEAQKQVVIIIQLCGRRYSVNSIISISISSPGPQVLLRVRSSLPHLRTCCSSLVTAASNTPRLLQAGLCPLIPFTEESMSHSSSRPLCFAFYTPLIRTRACTLLFT